MSLLEVQTFLASYLRDDGLRSQFRETGTKLPQLTTLSAKERQMIDDIDIRHLDKVADSVRTHRFTRTSSVFAVLLDQMARFIDVDEFYNEFDRTHTVGWWQRRAEMRRFEGFVLDTVVRQALPEYLIDLCRLCSVITVVAETPKIPVPDHSDMSTITTVRGHLTVHLRRPFDVVALRYNVVPALSDPDWRGDTVQPVPTYLLVQRDWSQHKRSRIFTLAGNPVLRELSDGPATVFDLGARIPNISYAALLRFVAQCYAEGIVHLQIPSELMSDYRLPEH